MFLDEEVNKCVSLYCFKKRLTQGKAKAPQFCIYNYETNTRLGIGFPLVNHQTKFQDKRSCVKISFLKIEYFVPLSSKMYQSLLY